MLRGSRLRLMIQGVQKDLQVDSAFLVQRVSVQGCMIIWYEIRFLSSRYCFRIYRFLGKIMSATSFTFHTLHP